MTLQHTTAPTAGPDTEFDLDLSIVSSGLVVADLMRSTDDGCGSTCQSACSNSTC
ncbi:FxLD family lanthipeptide [Amycolatopsis samaneae]|uniref:FxLD family lanthipeptide n=1 Tax=Amycolatopsis samaneae TaxID=664691 RepID=A0ABW5GTP5_9PSEU